LGFWVLFRELDSPDPGPGPEIKDILGVFERGEMGFSVKGELA
jgi:hypothetical protein